MFKECGRQRTTETIGSGELKRDVSVAFKRACAAIQWDQISGELGMAAQLDACLPCMQTVTGSILAPDNILWWRLVMKSFLLSFSPNC